VETSAENTILLDFDGSCAPFSWPKKPGPPYPGLVEALKRLKAEGFHIVIFTARMWKGWGPAYRQKQITEMLDWLAENKIPFDEVTNEKRPALWMIDDRALGVPTTKFGWEVLASHILGSTEDGYGKISRDD